MFCGKLRFRGTLFEKHWLTSTVGWVEEVRVQKRQSDCLQLKTEVLGVNTVSLRMFNYESHRESRTG
jgi:hypothetical protein